MRKGNGGSNLKYTHEWDEVINVVKDIDYFSHLNPNTEKTLNNLYCSMFKSKIKDLDFDWFKRYDVEDEVLYTKGYYVNLKKTCDVKLYNIENVIKRIANNSGKNAAFVVK